MKNLDQKIAEQMTFKFSFVDFFYAYCNSKGIDDPESDLTDEEYERLEKECEKKLTTKYLGDLHEAIMRDITERIWYTMQ